MTKSRFTLVLLAAVLFSYAAGIVTLHILSLHKKSHDSIVDDSVILRLLTSLNDQRVNEDTIAQIAAMDKESLMRILERLVEIMKSDHRDLRYISSYCMSEIRDLLQKSGRWVYSSAGLRFREGVGKLILNENRSYSMDPHCQLEDYHWLTIVIDNVRRDYGFFDHREQANDMIDKWWNIDRKNVDSK